MDTLTRRTVDARDIAVGDNLPRYEGVVTHVTRGNAHVAVRLDDGFVFALPQDERVTVERA